MGRPPEAHPARHGNLGGHLDSLDEIPGFDQVNHPREGVPPLMTG